MCVGFVARIALVWSLQEEGWCSLKGLYKAGCLRSVIPYLDSPMIPYPHSHYPQPRVIN